MLFNRGGSMKTLIFLTGSVMVVLSGAAVLPLMEYGLMTAAVAITSFVLFIWHAIKNKDRQPITTLIHGVVDVCAIILFFIFGWMMAWFHNDIWESCVLSGLSAGLCLWLLNRILDRLLGEKTPAEQASAQ